MDKKLGLVHVYTGDGKGKTSLAMGIALRAAGQNFKVCIIQFLKGGAYTGEYLAISNYLPKIEFIQFGKHCLKEQKQLKLEGFNGTPAVEFSRPDVECGDCRYCFLNDKEQADLARLAFQKAKEVISTHKFNFVILDEINNAMSSGLIGVNEVMDLLKSKPKRVEVILTGRNAPDSIIKFADLVTEMKEVKHPMNKGITSRKGVEY